MQAGEYSDLVKYLLMVRKRVKDAAVDSELLYAYARTGELGPLEEFLAAGGHQANLQLVGDRCFEEGLYDAARIIFSRIPNYGRLASTLVRLHQFQGAVDAARKANSPRTWKEVCYACVEEKEFKLAQLCGLNIIINADDLAEVSALQPPPSGPVPSILSGLASPGMKLPRTNARPPVPHSPSPQKTGF